MNATTWWQIVFQWLMREVAEIVGFVASLYHWILDVMGLREISIEGSLDGRVLLLLKDGREVPPEFLLREAVAVVFAFPILLKGGGEREVALELCVCDPQAGQALVVDKQLFRFRAGRNEVRGSLDLVAFWETPGADRCQLELRLQGRSIWRSPVGARSFGECRAEKLEAVLANLGNGEVLFQGRERSLLEGPHLHASLGNVHPILRVRAALDWLWVPALRLRVDLRLVDRENRPIRNGTFQLRFKRDAGVFPLASFELGLGSLQPGEYRVEALFRGRVLASKAFVLLEDTAWADLLGNLVAGDLQQSGQVRIVLKRGEEMRSAASVVEDFDFLGVAFCGAIGSLPFPGAAMRSSVDLFIAKGRSGYEKLDTRPLLASNGPVEIPFAVLRRDDHRYLRRSGKVRVKVMLGGAEIAQGTLDIVARDAIARAFQAQLTGEVCCPDGSTHSLQRAVDVRKGEGVRTHLSLKRAMPRIPAFLEPPHLQVSLDGQVLKRVALPWERFGDARSRVTHELTHDFLLPVASERRPVTVACLLGGVVVASLRVNLHKVEIVDMEGNLVEPDGNAPPVSDEELEELIRSASR